MPKLKFSFQSRTKSSKIGSLPGAGMCGLYTDPGMGGTGEHVVTVATAEVTRRPPERSASHGKEAWGLRSTSHLP